MQCADLPKVPLHSLGLGIPSPEMNVANSNLHVSYDIQLFKHYAVGPDPLSASLRRDRISWTA